MSPTTTRPAPSRPDTDSDTERRRGLIAFALALLPALAALVSHPGFVTQDGPAHLYNAHILAGSLGPDSPFREFYDVRWRPLPNWAGHLLSAAAVSAWPPLAAERAIAALTLTAFAGSVVWLRRRVSGWRGMTVAAPLAVLLAMNLAWLLGFTSFLLGACLFPITMGVWWPGRDRPGWGRSAAVAGLLVLGYFCHPVSLGLTVVGLGVLALAEPGTGRTTRRIRTAAAALPLVPLAVVYRGIMRGGGGVEPVWGQLAGRPWSPRAWAAQVGWVDPVSLAGKTLFPFAGRPWVGFALSAPVVWLAVGLAALILGTIRRPAFVHDRRGWAWLAAVLIVGGVVCPDTLGPSHGNYLPQRVVLLGLVALVPWLDLDRSRRTCRVGATALLVAWAVQSAFVWEYARTSDRLVGAFLRAAPHVGRGNRVATLLVGIRGRFRSNPLLHVDSLLGIGSGNILWANYETSHYYFPVQFRPGIDHPPALEFEEIARLDGPGEADSRADRWRRLLDRYHDAVDVLVVWGTDPRLDRINARWFEPAGEEGRVRVWRRTQRTRIRAKREENLGRMTDGK